MSKGFKDTELGLVPENWLVDSLGKYCKLQNGYAFQSSSFVVNGQPVVRISNVQDGKINLDNNIVFYSGQPISASFSIQKGDILIAMSGATTGKVGRYYHSQPALLNQRVGKFVANQEVLNSDFLFQILTSLPFKQRLFKDLATGAQPNIGGKQIEAIPIALPPLPEQEKIAEILSTVDEKITVIDEQIGQTQELKKGLMQRLLTKGIGHTKFKPSPLGEIPESWEASKVDFFLLDKKGAMKIGPFGSQLKKDTFLENGFKVYGQENIFEKSMDFGDRFISEEHFNRLKSCELLPNDFIISMMGTIGKCMVVPATIQRGIMDSHLLRLQIDKTKMSTSFLNQLFGSPLVLNQINALAVGGIMAGLSSKIVREIIFVIPPLPEQEKIAETLSTVDEKLELLQEKKQQYLEMKKGLMQLLLTGKLRVNHLIAQPELA